MITGILIYTKGDSVSFWGNQLIGLAVNMLSRLLTDFFFLDKKIKSKYSERINGINEEVERRLREAVEE